MTRAILISPPFPPAIGGVQTYAFELATRLAPRCERFAVIADRTHGDRAFDGALPFPVHRVPRLGDNLALSGIAAVAARARGMRCDWAFATHWSGAFAALSARRVSGFPRRVFAAVHGKELLLRPLERLRVAQAIYDAIRGRALSRSDLLFPVSSYTASLLSERGLPRARLRTVPNGVDADFFRPASASRLRARLGLGTRPVVLTVARLVPRKGIDSVIAVLPSVLAAVPDAVYLVVGTGPDRPRLEALAVEHHVAERVRFLGGIDRTELGDCYNACDAFVMPARVEDQDVEGFGLVFLEAGACERPVIGAREGGAVDAIVDSETGFLVPPREPAALADAIVRLLADRALGARMGRAARARILTSGTWDHAADTIWRAITDFGSAAGAA
jgi:phosphatidylinositol alpha-1,6-mannosyltransferase